MYEKLRKMKLGSKTIQQKQLVVMRRKSKNHHRFSLADVEPRNVKVSTSKSMKVSILMDTLVMGVSFIVITTYHKVGDKI